MQYKDRGGNVGALTIGAVVGALIAGAAVGVLTAPESGAGTRRRLRRGIADLSGARLRDHWDDLSTGLQRRRERREQEALVERLEARIDELEERLAEESAAAEEDVEVEEPSRGGTGSALGLAAGALLTWFLSSDQAEPARRRAKEVAGQARERAGDEWERFKKKRGAYRKSGDRIVPENAAGAGGPAYQ
jgi:gas vesicle protein